MPKTAIIINGITQKNVNQVLQRAYEDVRVGDFGFDLDYKTGLGIFQVIEKGPQRAVIRYINNDLGTLRWHEVGTTTRAATCKEIKKYRQIEVARKVLEVNKPRTKKAAPVVVETPKPKHPVQPQQADKFTRVPKNIDKETLNRLKNKYGKDFKGFTTTVYA